jgi:hypothetical protein
VFASSRSLANLLADSMLATLDEPAIHELLVIYLGGDQAADTDGGSVGCRNCHNSATFYTPALTRVRGVAAVLRIVTGGPDVHALGARNEIQAHMISGIESHLGLMIERRRKADP